MTPNLKRKEQNERLVEVSVNTEIDVLIIGGGPAGVATSLTLSARGIKHALVEAKATPIRKPGEALPPNAKPLLRQLGIDHLLENEAHIPYYGNQSNWNGAQLDSEHFIADVHGHGYLLDRLLFETQLHQLVQAPFYKGYRLKEVSEQKEELTIAVENENNQEVFKPKYVVDATGRKASVCRHFGVAPKVLDEWFALWFHIKAQSPKQISIESVEDGWWYAAPFSQSELTLMFFTRKEGIPKRKEIPSLLLEQFANASQLSEQFKIEATDLDQVQIRPSGTSCLEIPYGANWLAVGDAAYAYDPISSFGITSALAGGYYAGHALADTLAGDKEALSVYRYLMENAFQGYLEKLGKVYG